MSDKSNAPTLRVCLDGYESVRGKVSDAPPLRPTAFAMSDGSVVGVFDGHKITVKDANMAALLLLMLDELLEDPTGMVSRALHWTPIYFGDVEAEAERVNELERLRRNPDAPTA